MNTPERDAEIVRLMWEYDSPTAVRREMVVLHGVALSVGTLAGVVHRARDRGLLPIGRCKDSQDGTADVAPAAEIAAVEATPVAKVAPEAVEVEPVEVEDDPVEVEEKPQPKKRGVTLYDLRYGQCHWIVGRRGSDRFCFGEYLYCAKPSVPEKQYCPDCLRRLRAPPRSRSDRKSFVHPSHLRKQESSGE